MYGSNPVFQIRLACRLRNQSMVQRYEQIREKKKSTALGHEVLDGLTVILGTLS